MSLALAAFGLKAAGSIFGGLSARKAAKRKAAFQKKQVLMQRGYALEDLGRWIYSSPGKFPVR